MRFFEEEMRFDPAAGPVVVDVETGFATVGSYRMSSRKGGGAWSDLCSGKLADAPTHRCTIEVEGDPAGTFLLIVGNYGPPPGPGEGQVSVRYAFSQQDRRLGEVAIDEKVSTAESWQHLVRFLAAAG